MCGKRMPNANFFPWLMSWQNDGKFVTPVLYVHILKAYEMTVLSFEGSDSFKRRVGGWIQDDKL